jgi:glycosyltransferase involved in cell wall biosynthesis
VTLPPVIFVLPQSGAAADGGIASVGEIMARLERHRAIVVTNRESARTEEWRGRGVETHVIPFANDLASYWRCFFALRRLLARSGAKIVHANKPLALQLALAPARLAGAKIVLNLRDTPDPERKLSATRFRLLFEAADHVLFLSQDMAERWARIAANAKRAFSVTYSIVDLDRFHPRERPDGPPAVLLSGIVRKKKGQLDFLRNVAPILAREGIETWIAGDHDPSSDSYMRACAEAAGPLGDAVRFLGYRSDIPELMARSSVVAVASRHEGLVRAMIEAMACARPVVSFDISSAREILEACSGGSGTVVDTGDYRGMADALIGYCLDPARAAEAGAKGAAAAAELLAPDSVGERYERVYDRLGGAG